jgi:uncharacterized protein
MSVVRRTVQVLALAVGGMVLGNCSDASSVGVDEPLVIAGGGTTGVYYNYGANLSAALGSELNLDAEVHESGGSVDNLLRIATGEALLAFTQADTAADAVAGRFPFAEPIEVRSVARVYDEFVHLVVAADSDVEHIRDLAERRVSLGALDSGTELIARRLLAAAGMTDADVDNVSVGIDGSIDAMLHGDIEAFFWVGGLPTPGMVELSGQKRVKLVDLQDLVDSVSAEHGGGYRHATVPQGTYGLTESVRTMAVPNYLVTRADAPAELIEDVTRVLYESRVTIAREVQQAALLDRRRAIFTEPVDLHPGALVYYRETKL